LDGRTERAKVLKKTKEKSCEGESSNPFCGRRLIEEESLDDATSPSLLPFPSNLTGGRGVVRSHDETRKGVWKMAGDIPKERE
jgi:hypothetical protein